MNFLFIIKLQTCHAVSPYILIKITRINIMSVGICWALFSGIQMFNSNFLIIVIIINIQIIIIIINILIIIIINFFKTVTLISH